MYRMLVIETYNALEYLVKTTRKVRFPARALRRGNAASILHTHPNGYDSEICVNRYINFCIPASTYVI